MLPVIMNNNNYYKQQLMLMHARVTLNVPHDVPADLHSEYASDVATIGERTNRATLWCAWFASHMSSFPAQIDKMDMLHINK